MGSTPSHTHQGRRLRHAGYVALLSGVPAQDGPEPRPARRLHSTSLPEIMRMPKPIIAITMGDAAGVGPEVIMKSLAHPSLYEICCPLVVGDTRRLLQAAHITNVQLEVRTLSPATIDEAHYTCGVIDCVDLELIPHDLLWGRLSREAGEAAYRYLEVAARLAMEGRVAAICTAPLNKEALHLAGHKFPGHTELLA